MTMHQQIHYLDIYNYQLYQALMLVGLFAVQEWDLLMLCLLLLYAQR